jgi:hypothetical protein
MVMRSKWIGNDNWNWECGVEGEFLNIGIVTIVGLVRM